MIFYTISGSVYELDSENKQIRRMVGKENPTPRQGTDGEWKKFSNCTEVRVGESCLIQWENEKATVTSVVATILNDNVKDSN